MCASPRPTPAAMEQVTDVQGRDEKSSRTPLTDLDQVASVSLSRGTECHTKVPLSSDSND